MSSHQFLQAGLLNLCAYVPMTTLKGCTAGGFWSWPVGFPLSKKLEMVLLFCVLLLLLLLFPLGEQNKLTKNTFSKFWFGVYWVSKKLCGWASPHQVVYWVGSSTQPGILCVSWLDKTNGGYQHSLLSKAFCFRLCIHSHKKGDCMHKWSLRA